jgi:hypothetical protein
LHGVFTTRRRPNGSRDVGEAVVDVYMRSSILVVILRNALLVVGIGLLVLLNTAMWGE